jgi:hypothetical protein
MRNPIPAHPSPSRPPWDGHNNPIPTPFRGMGCCTASRSIGSPYQVPAERGAS